MSDTPYYQTIALNIPKENLQHASAMGMGAWFKNTLAIGNGDFAWVSTEAENLDCAEHCTKHDVCSQQLLADWQKAGLALPEVFAHDLHPDFYSTQRALALADNYAVDSLAIQHHHAHIAAVMAEFHINEPCVGLALDGVGLGTDETAWGGELLLVYGSNFRRLGYLRSIKLAGGDKAAKEPWRMAAAVLHDLGLGNQIEQRFLSQPASSLLATMLDKNLQCPITTSMGRLFDAVAGLLGLHPVQQFEAQAAIALQEKAEEYLAKQPKDIACFDDKEHAEDFFMESGVLDFSPLLQKIADVSKVPPDASTIEYWSARFHLSLGYALAKWCEFGVNSARQPNVKGLSAASSYNKIVLAGGCFLNSVLRQQLISRLQNKGLTVYLPEKLPSGDQAIALGQLWVTLQSRD